MTWCGTKPLPEPMMAPFSDVCMHHWTSVTIRPKGYCRCQCLSVRPLVLPLVLGVVTRQKPQINGSVVLGADESPWPYVTPIWYTPLSWMILSKQRNLHLFSSQYICVFSKTSICKLYLVCTITHHRLELKSPNLHQTCFMGYLELVLKMGAIDFDLQGHFGYFGSEF